MYNKINTKEGRIPMKLEKNCVLICVTPQKSCARLIEAGIEIAREENREAVVLTVIGNQYKNDLAALNYLYDIVERNNIQMKMYFNNEPAITAAVVAKRFAAGCIVTGLPEDNGGRFISLFRDLLPDIPVTMVGVDKTRFKLLPAAESYGAGRISVEHKTL